MGLKGVLITKTEIKSSHGDFFHDLFAHKPHHISKFSSKKIESIELHEGEYGKKGSVLSWNYVHEGQKKHFKTVVEDVDEEKKTVKFKAIEGEVLESYKTFSFTLHVETHKHGETHEHNLSLHFKSHKHDEKHEHGHEKEHEHEHLLTWTFEYEKKHEEIPPPTSYLDFAHEVTKDIESCPVE